MHSLFTDTCTPTLSCSPTSKMTEKSEKKIISSDMLTTAKIKMYAKK